MAMSTVYLTCEKQHISKLWWTAYFETASGSNWETTKVLLAFLILSVLSSYRVTQMFLASGMLLPPEVCHLQNLGKWHKCPLLLFRGRKAVSQQIRQAFRCSASQTSRIGQCFQVNLRLLSSLCSPRLSMTRG